MTLDRRQLLALSLGTTVLGTESSAALSSLRGGPAEDDATWTYEDASKMHVEGRGWSEGIGDFRRLPDRAKGAVRDRVWTLSGDSSGIHVDFLSGAKALRFEVLLSDEHLAMPHMPASGVSGIDLYARKPGQSAWRWLRAAAPSGKAYSLQVGGLPGELLEYRLYLPLYNGVESLRIGVPEGASLEPAKADTETPVVYYGTSIAQGACASRPGMAFVAQLGRRLGVPMVNLGFSGNGKLEMELCDLIAEIDATVYVLDCLPNLSPAETAERAEPFVARLREKRPDVPIVMVEDRVNANAALQPDRMAHHRRNHGAFRAAYEALVNQGVGDLTYVPDAPFLGEDGEATVDGSHPTDLGMVRYADALEPVLRQVLGGR